LLVTYVPPGIPIHETRQHHTVLLENIRLFAPDVVVAIDQVRSAGA
jgi:hypothetical protein